MNDTTPGTNTSRRSFGKAVAGVTAGASLAPAFVRAQTSKVKVGVLLPRSGYLAQLGQSCQRGVDIAPEILREMYGVDLELMNVDFESNVDQARARAEKLINDGAQVLVGPFESGAAAAIAQVAEQRKIPFVINIAAAPQITEQGYKYTFRNFTTGVDLMRNGLALCRDLFQATQSAPRTAVLLCANDPFGVSNKRAFDAIFPKLDYLPFKLVDSIMYDPAARDLSVEVAKAKASGADLALMICRLNDAIMIVREMVKQRWSPQGLISPGSPGMYEDQFFKAVGKYSEYAISNVPWYDPKAKLTAVVEKAFDKRFPKDRLMFHALNVGFTFEAMMVVADAVRRVKSTDSEALTDAIRKTNIAERMMLGGPIRFNEKGQNTEIASAALQNRNMRPTVVLPAKAAQAAPVFPVPEWSRRG